jgi:putative DNA primase/helicase
MSGRDPDDWRSTPQARGMPLGAAPHADDDEDDEAEASSANEPNNVATPSAAEAASIRHKLWGGWFRPIPILNWNHPDKARAGKAPLGNNWTDLARRDPPDCLNYPPVQHALNTGILADALRAFDLDIDDADLAAHCRCLTIDRLGDAPRRYRGNSGRCLLLYRAAEGERRKVSIAGNLGKIEVLGHGQQFVAHGVHPSGAALEWFPDPPWLIARDSLPAVSEEQVHAVLAELAPLIEAPPPPQPASLDRAPGEPQADPLRVAVALQAIANNGPADWEFWNRVGMAAWRATGGSNLGFEAFDHWSQRNTAYSAEETSARWNHYSTSPPSQIGAGTLFRMAAQARADYQSTADPGYHGSQEREALERHSRGRARIESEPEPESELASELTDDDPEAEAAAARSNDSAAAFEPTNEPPKADDSASDDDGPEPDEAATRAKLDAALKHTKATPPPSQVTPLACEPTEDAVADAFAKHYENRLAYDHTEETWFEWRDRRWIRDERNRGFHYARHFCRAIRARLNEPPKALAKIAFCASVERAARADPILARSHEVWNTDKWLLGTPDGSVDLRSGVLSPARPDLYISRHTTVAPAPPGTQAPQWVAFLDSATKGDKDFQSFLQRLGGYILTGDVSEEVMVFLYGPGGNGKGTFLTILTSILGDYAVSLPIEVFTAGSRVNAEYYRAQIAGARLITASETEAQATWAEAQIKEITGNDVPVSGRHPRGRPFSFMVQAKIMIVGNHAPKLKGRSPAMERRLRVAPFTNMPAKPDLALKDKLRGEAPAILRWLIDGCLEWQRTGLGTAQIIQDASCSYFDQQDAFGRWVDERCEFKKGAATKTGLLLADFNAWAKDNGEDPMSNNAFAEMIDRTPGLSRGKNHGVRVVRGLAFVGSSGGIAAP